MDLKVTFFMDFPWLIILYVLVEFKKLYEQQEHNLSNRKT